jgi:ribonucleoside-diphosphate reductase alpha chain
MARTPVRRKLPDERHAITHKFDIQGHEGYITVGLFEDGQPGEIFLVMAKEGSTISGFADAFAQAISYALQYGVPLQALVDKFSHVRFEPSGMTRNPEIRFAKSIVDYIFRWLASKFLSPEAQFHAGVNGRELEESGVRVSDQASASMDPPKTPAAKASPFATIQNQEDAPPCSTCGSIMIRSGACYKCVNCGNTSGCA